jgi:predicted ATPase
LALAADDALRDSVRKWYRNTFGVRIDVASDGRYSNLVTGTPGRDDDVGIAQSGRGLSHILPVVVTALTARGAGAGVDVIEHPEAELHPAAHADIAELLMENLAGPSRPLVVETHSEMVLLRARRWVAEGRLPAGHVLVYWIHTEPGHGSMAEKISIRENGEMETWPDGVFIEDYEEVLAIRRAARKRGLEQSANHD